MRSVGTLEPQAIVLNQCASATHSGQRGILRKQRLGRLLTGHPRSLEVEHIEHDGLSMFAGAKALGLEGIVAKDGKSPYVEGPRVTWHWQKVKNREYQRKEKVEFRPRKT